MSERLSVCPELLAAAISGDRAATDRVIVACWPHAYRIAAAILRSREAAEDAAQEACAVLYRNVVRLRVPAAFNTWFYRIVVRQATLLQRKRRLAEIVAAVLPQPEAETDPTSRIDVLAAVDRLPTRQRTVVMLSYYARMNSREIAGVLGIPDSSVRFALMNAKKTLATLLDDRATPAFRWENAHAV